MAAERLLLQLERADHLFGLHFGVEFLLLGAASSSVFFILLVMSLIDVVAGFTMSITSATRDMSMAGH